MDNDAQMRVDRIPVAIRPLLRGMLRQQHRDRWTMGRALEKWQNMHFDQVEEKFTKFSGEPRDAREKSWHTTCFWTNFEQN